MIPWTLKFNAYSIISIYNFTAKQSEIEWRVSSSVSHTIIGEYNGLPPVRHQVIIWFNAALLSIRSLWTNFSEILMKHKWFLSREWIWKYRLQNFQHFVTTEICQGNWLNVNVAASTDDDMQFWYQNYPLRHVLCSSGQLMVPNPLRPMEW